jgi:hypothetical protein
LPFTTRGESQSSFETKPSLTLHHFRRVLIGDLITGKPIKQAKVIHKINALNYILLHAEREALEKNYHAAVQL